VRWPSKSEYSAVNVKHVKMIAFDDYLNGRCAVISQAQRDGWYDHSIIVVWLSKAVS